VMLALRGVGSSMRYFPHIQMRKGEVTCGEKIKDMLDGNGGGSGG